MEPCIHDSIGRWSECRDSLALFFPQGSIIMVLPPAGCRQASVPRTLAFKCSNLSFEKKKAETVDTVSAFLVRVSRFELEAS